MKNIPEADQIKKIVDSSKRILILQADNPDGDSLGSALALESILGEIGIETTLYCAVKIPDYLRYIDGWDRVQTDIPSNFDASIIVDVSTDSLFDSLNKTPEKNLIAKKPSIIIDHHFVDKTIGRVDVVCVQEAVATAEVIYELSKQLDWPLSNNALKPLLAAILADSLGLTSEGTSARSIEIVAEIVKNGVTIAEIEYARRELAKKTPALLHYKGELLQRVEYFDDDRISIVSIPWIEIEKYSHDYNPSVLVLDDMRQTNGVAIVIAFKIYKDGKVTAKIRCNHGYGIADKLAKHFGGGGHAFASGFKITNGKTLEAIKSDTIKITSELLNEVDDNLK